MTLQIVRDWVVEFNADGPVGLIDKKSPGVSPLLSPAHREALAKMVESGPIPAAYPLVRWRIIDLCQRTYDEFGVSVSQQTMSRVLRAMNYRKLSARPHHHAQAKSAITLGKTLLESVCKGILDEESVIYGDRDDLPKL